MPPKPDGSRWTVEERHQRVSEIGNRLNEIDREYAGGALPPQAQQEFHELGNERNDHLVAIADATARSQYLQTINGQGNPDGAAEGVDPQRTGYAGGGTNGMDGRSGGFGPYGGGQDEPGSYIPNFRYTGPPAGMADRSGAFRGGAPAYHRGAAQDIWDLAGIRQRANGFDDLPRLYRDYAMRAIEQATFPGVRDREGAQSNVARMLDTIDADEGKLAHRLLVTGSPLYERAFGKALKALNTNVLSSEESRALVLGTDAAGGYAVPFQLDPTVILTYNGVINPLRDIARVEQITGKEWDGVTSTGITVSRVAEATEATDGSPALVQPSVRTTRVQGFVPFSIELDVSWGALRSQLTAMLADAKDIEEATSFTLGNGTPPNANGIVTTLNTASKVFTATTATVAIKDLYAVESAAAPKFRAQAVWLASKTSYNFVRQLFQQQASAAGDPWVRPSAGTPAEFIGYPAYESSPMAGPGAPTSGNSFMLFGDFTQFLIVDRVGMGIELVPHLFGATARYPTGQRGLFAIWFNNSKVLADNAFRLLTVL